MPTDPHQGGDLSALAKDGTSIPNDAGKYDILKSVPRPDQLASSDEVGGTDLAAAASNAKDLPNSTSDTGATGEVLTGTGDVLDASVESKRLGAEAHDPRAKGHNRLEKHQKQGSEFDEALTHPVQSSPAKSTRKVHTKAVRQYWEDLHPPPSFERDEGAPIQCEDEDDDSEDDSLKEVRQEAARSVQIAKKTSRTLFKNTPFKKPGMHKMSAFTPIQDKPQCDDRVSDTSSTTLTEVVNEDIDRELEMEDCQTLFEDANELFGLAHDTCEVVAEDENMNEQSDDVPVVDQSTSHRERTQSMDQQVDVEQTALAAFHDGSPVSSSKLLRDADIEVIDFAAPKKPTVYRRVFAGIVIPYVKADFDEYPMYRESEPDEEVHVTTKSFQKPAASPVRRSSRKIMTRPRPATTGRPSRRGANKQLSTSLKFPPLLGVSREAARPSTNKKSINFNNALNGCAPKPKLERTITSKSGQVITYKSEMPWPSQLASHRASVPYELMPNRYSRKSKRGAARGEPKDKASKIAPRHREIVQVTGRQMEERQNGHVLRDFGLRRYVPLGLDWPRFESD